MKQPGFPLLCVNDAGAAMCQEDPGCGLLVYSRMEAKREVEKDKPEGDLLIKKEWNGGVRKGNCKALQGLTHVPLRDTGIT